MAPQGNVILRLRPKRFQSCAMIQRARVPQMPRLAALVAILACFGAAICVPAQAETQPPPKAVLELFTSQGCSSCPAADALFVELARDPSLLVLTLPVDYWDYLGWRDTLAHSSFTQRQRLYAKMRGDGQIYTPQAVLNGHAHLVGSDREAIRQAVSATAGPLPVPLGVRRVGEALRVTIGTPAVDIRAGSLWLAPVARTRTVQVQRGENKGREITYANVARGLMRIAEWQGRPMTLDVPASLLASSDGDSFVVLLHAEEGRIGRIVGAARGPGL
jgi:hypothetical protein